MELLLTSERIYDDLNNALMSYHKSSQSSDQWRVCIAFRQWERRVREEFRCFVYDGNLTGFFFLLLLLCDLYGIWKMEYSHVCTAEKCF